MVLRTIQPGDSASEGGGGGWEWGAPAAEESGGTPAAGGDGFELEGEDTGEAEGGVEVEVPPGEGASDGGSKSESGGSEGSGGWNWGNGAPPASASVLASGATVVLLREVFLWASECVCFGDKRVEACCCVRCLKIFSGALHGTSNCFRFVSVVDVPSKSGHTNALYGNEVMWVRVGRVVLLTAAGGRANFSRPGTKHAYHWHRRKETWSKAPPRVDSTSSEKEQDVCVDGVRSNSL